MQALYFLISAGFVIRDWAFYVQQEMQLCTLTGTPGLYFPTGSADFEFSKLWALYFLTGNACFGRFDKRCGHCTLTGSAGFALSDKRCKLCIS